MSLKLYFIKTVLPLSIFLAGFAFYAQTASANSLTLTVDPPVIVNGQTVTLEWNIPDNLSSCSINNDVGPVAGPTGSLTVTPPEDAEVNYVLTCGSESDSVFVNTKPIVDISFSYLIDNIWTSTSTVPLNADGGVKNLKIYWSSQFAEKCGDVEEDERMWYETESEPGVKRELGRWSHKILGDTNGYVEINHWHPEPNLTETATFFMECENETLGTDSIGSSTLTVLNQGPPPAPKITIWTNNEYVEIEPETGYAVTDVKFKAENASYCTYKAYDENGIQYDNPFGWGTLPSIYTETHYHYIPISKTTDFEVTCGRGSLIRGGVEYPATSTSARVMVYVQNEDLITSRADLPPVTITNVVTPNPAVKDPITNKVRVRAELSLQNADYCLNTAFDENDNRVVIHGWSREGGPYSWQYYEGNRDYTLDFDLDRTVFLETTCVREVDVNSGDPTLMELGSETYRIRVDVTESAEPAPQPIVNVYGNAFKADVSTIMNSATINEFVPYHNGNWLQNSNETYLETSTVVFPFEHPSETGGSGIFDVYLLPADTDDAESIFSLSTDQDGLIGSHTTNLSDGLTTNWWYNNAVNPVLIASDVSLSDGELLTLECSSNDSDHRRERCKFTDLWFGESDGGVTSVERGSDSNFEDISLFWVSENTSSCLAPHQAFSSYGQVANWNFNSARYGYSEEQISTSTEFRVRCEQANGVIGEGRVRIDLESLGVQTASVGLSTGACIDVDNLFGRNVDGQPSASIPFADLDGTGIGSFVDDSRCRYLVDLQPIGPGVSNSPVGDGRTGTYDNLDVLIGIYNDGLGQLPGNSNIRYAVDIDFDPTDYPALSTKSEEDYYNGAAIDSKGDVTETLVFDGVPFGTHDACAEVNLNPTNLQETDLGNNESCGSITLPVPQPDMDIYADREIIRSGQSANINWYVDVTYPSLVCSVRGAGGLNVNFETELPSANRYAGSFDTTALTSSSEYVFECTEQITGEQFTDTLFIEVVPAYEEI